MMGWTLYGPHELAKFTCEEPQIDEVLRPELEDELR